MKQQQQEQKVNNMNIENNNEQYDDDDNFFEWNEKGAEIIKVPFIEEITTKKVKVNHFDGSRAVSKPKLFVTIDEEDLFINIGFDYNTDLSKLLKKHLNTVKYDKNSKTFNDSYNYLNASRVQDFINECYEIFGDIERVFDFSFSIIERKEVKEIKKVNIMSKLSVSKEDKKANKKSSKILEGELVDSSKKMTDVKEIYAGKVSIFEQKQTVLETIEEQSWRLLKDVILINTLSYSVYAYDENLGCYKTNSENKKIGIKDIISKVLVKNNLSHYTTPYHLKSIEEHVTTQAYTFNRTSFFNNKFVAVKLKNSTTLDKAVIYLTKNNNGDRLFRVLECSPEIETNVFADVELDASLIKNEDGEIWAGEDLTKFTFFYMFEVNRKASLFTLFLNDLFESENFEKIAKRYVGSFFSGNKPQKSIIFGGEGGDGKSAFFDMLMILFPMIIASFKLNQEKGDSSRFQNAVLKDKKIGLVSEIKEALFNFTLFKNITGNDVAYAESKGVDQFKLDTKNLFVMIAMNYQDLFRVPEMDQAMRRRLLFIKCQKSKRVILNFAEKIMNGFYFEEENVYIESQKLELVHWMLEGAIEAETLNSFSDSGVTAEKYGEDVYDFYESMIEKMSPRTEFFTEYDIQTVVNGNGVTLVDLYSYYENWAKLSKVTPLGLNNFKRELVKHANAKHAIKVDSVDFRAKVGNASKRVLPLTISGAKIEQYVLEYPKKLVSAGILTEEEFEEKFNVKEKEETAKKLKENIEKVKPDEMFDDLDKQQGVNDSNEIDDFSKELEECDELEKELLEELAKKTEAKNKDIRKFNFELDRELDEEGRAKAKEYLEAEEKKWLKKEVDKELARRNK